ncbi:MAG: VacJ family lipoprotein [Pseudohongiellaceae bacterium]
MFSLPVARFRVLSAMLLTFTLCAPVFAMAQDSLEDPWSPVNKRIFTFNQHFDDWFMRPLAKGYAAVVPPPAQKGVRNFLSNLDDVTVMVNSALQGKAADAASDGGRVLLNTTFGVVGLWDVARHVGLEKNSEDFGQTLGVWGVGPGPYVIIPFLGPSTFRDTFGLGIDVTSSPISLAEKPATRNMLHAMDILDTRVQALQLDDLMYGDRYIFMREAYLQQRQYEVTDGEMPSARDDSDPWSDWD